VFHWEACWFLCFFTADSLVLTENRDRAVQFPVRVAHLSSIAVAPPARVSKVGSGSLVVHCYQKLVAAAHLSSIAVAPPARVSKVGSGGCAGGIISGGCWAVPLYQRELQLRRSIWISLQPHQQQQGWAQHGLQRRQPEPLRVARVYKDLPVSCVRRANATHRLSDHPGERKKVNR
jgi:hypothetical protein